MKYRKDGTEQIQAGGCKPVYTAYVRQVGDTARLLRAEIEDRQAVRAAHLDAAARETHAIDELERRLDATLALADEVNDEMHAVIVRAEPLVTRVLRLFTWRELTRGEARAVAVNRTAA